MKETPNSRPAHGSDTAPEQFPSLARSALDGHVPPPALDLRFPSLSGDRRRVAIERDDQKRRKEAGRQQKGSSRNEIAALDLGRRARADEKEDVPNGRARVSG
ncbi:hypothetical protein A3F27_03410 [Candidatus Kaiserbacteria bacterium RIFCSPHIGHO2_12_FULL_53_13]|uniref:Uncharacterized protein n=1 Tax=Candidatus Kaiserbacteria bacterium RIFCSPHIGHO2_12_FULL_53_13 TaxID=1798502 RepID=A0A1F6E633_9BACT|nr:MAG: hypothetical protein A3F27_03410 [Candidatus Kaiserbacteria bacterium RIFCSPHIGHO2_12_FULL_53_13]OGG74385.1 MAG: hypothetical protein A3A37_00255 [Candidatus Kaiserbacteria bacterium RIFCSPLOWO2_01_FULL_52_36]